MRRPPQPVENYTNPFLAMTGVILFMAFWTITAIVGFVWVVVSAALIDIGIRFAQGRSRTTG